VVALCATLVGLAAFVVAPKGGGSVNQRASERQILAMESAALQRLRFPADFVRIERGCSTARCYLVAGSASRVAATMPGLLRAAGVQPPGGLRTAEPVSLLRRAHWSTASRDPLVIACKTIYTRAERPLTACQDAGRVGQTLINVLIRPYQPCHSRTCSDPSKTEILAWSVAFPNNP